MNWRHFIIAFAILTTVPVMAADQATTFRRLEAKFQEAIRLRQAKDWKACVKHVRAVIGASDFAGLNKKFRNSTYYLALSCSLDAGDLAASQAFAVQATLEDDASAEMWRLRGEVEMRNVSQPTAAVIGLEAMAARAPDALNGLPQKLIYEYYNRVKKGPDASLRRRTLEVFAAKAYQPHEIGGTADHFRSELAKLRAAEGDRTGASTLIATIAQPIVLLELSLDPRTRSLIPDDFNFRAVTERELAHRRDVAASHPASLVAVIEVANALRMLGRYEEALAGLAAASPEGAAADTFTDHDKQLNWWWDAVAFANANLGRYDAALAAFQQGITVIERGGANVSQLINLAIVQMNFGRDVDAIATLAPMREGKGTSPYGALLMISARGCARFRVGDKVGSDADYTYAKMHEQDAPGTLTSLALCRNDLDEAAASLVRRLDHMEQRIEALVTVSDFDPPPAAFPKQVEDERLALVKARPEVKAAIARAGGARRFNLMSPPF